MRRDTDKEKRQRDDKGDPRGTREKRTVRGGTGKELPEKGDNRRIKNR
ncbi:hypothetical protein [Candidatus Berkiella aquae]|uniref:Uncharacterized protein n=1 Tax=Candidatus Berkiella aquae TaxID=295108 RepID=A0A0Q9YPE7_9GAMM|nr:hypothetical protein [Candidatus Berkiella aquae]MCS5711944.1 hypothetical protein [Candidatus Berkiella aquae]